MADKFLVAPFKSGLIDNMTSWLIPEEAFTRLNNAYVFRGKLKKRFGSKLIGTTTTDQYQNLNSRLRVKVGTTDINGDLSATVPGTIAVGQMFSVGTALYTIDVTGNPAVMKETVTTTTATIDTTTGALVLVGAPASEDVFFYSSYPVMGFANFELGPVNEHTSFAFDKKFAYKYDGSSWNRSGTIVFNGSDTDFFWHSNWRGITDDLIAMFVTNFNVTTSGAPAATDDPMYYYNGTTWTNFSTVTTFNGAGHTIKSASMIIPFKNRLLLIDTVENDGAVNKRYHNRVRFCHNGSPLSNTAWLEPNQTFGGNAATGGGYIDGPVEEEIVSIAFVKDRLIVFCERSTWELSYTGNKALPFVWQAINQVLGSEAKFSTVIFDKNVITIGTTGINSCNGSHVQRIDEEIPNKVFEILKTTNGTKRIVGVRDFFNEMVYWSYLKQSHSDENSYNDSLIAYNYRTGSWAFNDDCITSFGYLEKEKDITDANSKQIICGNQKGFIFVVDSSLGKNSHAMTVTEMSYSDPDVTLTVYDHNIRVGDFIKVEHPQGISGFTDGIYKVTSRVSSDKIKITASFTGAYTGGGLISRVSRIEVETKDMNPYVSDGSNVSLVKVDFNVDKTTNGEVLIDFSTSTSSLNMVSEESSTSSNIGNNVLETRAYISGASYVIPLEEYQDKLWHEVNINALGNFVKLKITLSDTQMLDEDIAESMFTLNGMVLNTEKAGR